MGQIEFDDVTVDEAIKRHGRFAALAILGWAAILVALMGYVVAWTYFDNLACETFPNSSSYGEVVWSVLPPGPTCTFTEVNNGFDGVRGPSPIMSILILLFVAMGLFVARQLRTPVDRDGSIRS